MSDQSLCCLHEGSLGPQGGTLNFHTYVGSGHFWGDENFEFQYFFFFFFFGGGGGESEK